MSLASADGAGILRSGARLARSLRLTPGPVYSFPRILARTLLVLSAALGGCSGPAAEDLTLPHVDVTAFESSARQLIQDRLAAARARPDDGQALGTAAMALHAYRILEPAVDIYRRAVARAPDEFRWHYLMGLVAGRGARAV